MQFRSPDRPSPRWQYTPCRVKQRRGRYFVGPDGLRVHGQLASCQRRGDHGIAGLCGSDAVKSTLVAGLRRSWREAEAMTSQLEQEVADLCDRQAL